MREIFRYKHHLLQRVVLSFKAEVRVGFRGGVRKSMGIVRWRGFGRDLFARIRRATQRGQRWLRQAAKSSNWTVVSAEKSLSSA